MQLVQPFGTPVMSRTPPQEGVEKRYEDQLGKLNETLLHGITGIGAYSQLAALRDMVLGAATNWPVDDCRLPFVPVVPLAFFGEKTLKVICPRARMTMMWVDIKDAVDVGASPYWLVNLPEREMLRIRHTYPGCYKAERYSREFTAAELVALATHGKPLTPGGMLARASVCKNGRPWLRLRKGMPELTSTTEHVGETIWF